MSMRTIAQMTGLSVTTVSHALNGTRVVSKRSMELINEAAEKINYRPNLAAQMMKTQRSRTVALIIPETVQNNSTNCFFFDVMNGAKSRLEESSYELIVSIYPESIAKDYFSKMSILRRRWVDGILLVPPTMQKEDIAFIKNCDVPVVLIDRWVEGESLPLVASNNREISAAAVCELYNSGSRNIAFIGASFRNSTAVERYQGYVDALQMFGLPVNDKLICLLDSHDISSSMRATESVLKEGADAIFVANSMLCLGTIKQLQLCKLKMPDDVAVIGFNNFDWAEITNPPFSSVVQKANQIGRTASEQLLKILNGEELEAQSVRISAELQLKQTHKKTNTAL